jgi:hypothetical protein
MAAGGRITQCGPQVSGLQGGRCRRGFEMQELRVESLVHPRIWLPGRVLLARAGMTKIPGRNGPIATIRRGFPGTFLE